MLTLSPHGASLILLGALLICALFHFVYAVDHRRLYTLFLVDRCNTMRWAQFGLMHTALAMVVAQLVGVCTFDFMVMSMLMLPCLGVVGYFGDRAYPCCPRMAAVAVFGIALILLGFWIPVITNFAYRNSEAGVAAPAYMWIALIALLIFDVVFFVSPIIQLRLHFSYFLIETMSTVGLMILSAVILGALGWALNDQAAN